MIVTEAEAGLKFGFAAADTVIFTVATLFAVTSPLLFTVAAEELDLKVFVPFAPLTDTVVVCPTLIKAFAAFTVSFWSAFAMEKVFSTAPL